MANEISRLEIFCDDKLVMPIKRMLLGMKGIHQINDQPVVNAKADKGTVRAKTSGKIADLLIDYFRSKKLDGQTINANHFRDFQLSVGRTVSGYSGAIAAAHEAGLIKKNRARNQKYQTYTVHLKG